MSYEIMLIIAWCACSLFNFIFGLWDHFRHCDSISLGTFVVGLIITATGPLGTTVTIPYILYRYSDNIIFTRRKNYE